MQSLLFPVLQAQRVQQDRKALLDLLALKALSDLLAHKVFKGLLDQRVHKAFRV